MIKFLRIFLLIIGVPLLLIIGLIISISIYSLPLYLFLLIIKLIFSINFNLSWIWYYLFGSFLLLIHKSLIKLDHLKSNRYLELNDKISQNLDEVYKNMNIFKV